jgi:hypothetical protein
MEGWNGNCGIARITCIRNAAMPRTSSTSRARRIRRIGLLGLLLTTLLTPAGIFVSTVTAAALIGGAFHLSRAKPETAVTPLQPVSMKRGNPQHLNIERDGKTLALIIAEDTLGNGSGAGSFDPASPLFAGLTRGDPARRSAAGGGMPGSGAPGGGYAPGGGGPENPPTRKVDGDETSNKDDADETSNEEGAPEKPDEKPILPPPTVNHQPNPDHQPPEKENGLPPDTLPGSEPDTLAGTPLDTQIPPPAKQLAAQPNAVPEPSMLGLMLLGVAALAWTGRRRPHPLSPA